MRAVLLLVAPPDALAAERVLASERAYTSVVVFQDTVAWSSLDARGRYRLTIYAGGKVVHPRVRSRPVRFDVDLGPDARGRTVAVYSRCREEDRTVLTPRGCDIYQLDVRSGRERRLGFTGSRGYSETSPSIWRRLVAFARYRDPPNRQYAVLHQLQVRSIGGRVWRVGGGTPAGPEVADPDGHAGQTDLVGRQLVFDWNFSTQACSPLTKGSSLDFAQEIWRAKVGRRSRRVDYGCADAGNYVVGSSLTPSFLAYTRQRGDKDEELLVDLATGEVKRRYPLTSETQYLARYGDRVVSVRKPGDAYLVVLEQE